MAVPGDAEFIFTKMNHQAGRFSTKLDSDIDQTIVDLDADSDTSQRLRRRLLLQRFWQSAASFWRGSHARASWLLTTAILFTILLNLAVSYGMNVWNRSIFDSLQRQDSKAVLFTSLIYFPLLASSVSLMAAQVYARMAMQRRWRHWLTQHLLDRWLRNGRHYQLNLVTGGSFSQPKDCS